MPTDRRTAEHPVPSVWTRTKRSGRDRPALSQGQIVAAALRLLDEEGLGALSMRTLGARLDAGAASLYRHVSNKDELIELVVDEVYGELEIPEPPGPDGWRPAVVAAAGSLRAMALRHPWVVSVLGQVGLARLGPNLGRQSERLLAVFGSAGLDAAAADLAMSALVAYVTGMATSEVAYQSLREHSGQSEEGWRESLKQAVEATAEAHPLVVASLRANEAKSPTQLQDDYFRYGLDLMLDGLQQRLTCQN
ncbi:TetR/AcrR family transcriptional regulator [Microlunatus speluncae]|uniref:TetR/AcrR family transcriptional regulator n=1 Tax=Microlunatus speluncae TaxID=2594267 RepID=UPI001C2D243A|nr:TetR/AcrR family transcriptional regulator [Microlunatus speluncae]